MSEKIFCVISHTHWDREWYMPLEVFRLKLVDLIDRCMETLEKYPEFIFHLDAQTVVLEDYLVIRQSKKKALIKFISEGRLVVGPWYLQNDFYLTSGEATIRNLLEGNRLARQFGNCTKVGYAPDQFGNISQLPQILQGFGIDNFIFGRGFNEYEFTEENKRVRKPTTSEFIWRGADGTEVLAIHMPYWYNNAQRFSEKLETSKLLLERIEKSFQDVALTPYLLLMNGVDHLEAQDNLLPILDKLNKDMASDKKIMQYHMQDYVTAVKTYIEMEELQLPIHEGEIRSGHDFELLKGTLSSRSYLKKENVKAQNTLENKLEPLYAIAELAGLRRIYSLEHFRYMWKELMKNHPHDSICGCSRDEVHSHMEDNFKRIKEMSDEMLSRGLRTVAEHMNLLEYKDNNFVIIVANTTEKPQSQVVNVMVDIPVQDEMDSFKIVNNAGESIEFTVSCKERITKDVFSPINLPGTILVDRYHIYLWAEKINPFAVKGYILKETKKEFPYLQEQQKTQVETARMENNNLIVEVNAEGKVTITDKRNNRVYENTIEIEETGDRGYAYVYFDTDEKAIYGSEFPASIRVIEDNAYVQRIKIVKTLQVPKEYNFDLKARSTELVLCEVELILTLKKNDKWVEVEYSINNQAKDHRVRLIVNTGILSKESVADIPFDIIKKGDRDHDAKTRSKVLPNTSFALLEKDNLGMAVLTEGTHEYEHLQETCGLAFTLVRGTGVMCRTEDLKVYGGDAWQCPDNQSLRKISGRVAIMPYQDNYIKSNIPFCAKQFRTPMLSYFTACDTRKFTGGSPTVQDSELSELFFLPDQYSEIKIEDNRSYVQVMGEGILVTALKKAEEEDGIICRFLNYSDYCTQVRIESKMKIIECSFAEQPINQEMNESICCEMSSKKIRTFKMVY